MKQVGIVFLLLGLIGAGCTTPAGTVTIPALPEWREPADPRPLSALAVRGHLWSILPGVPVHTADSLYSRINHEWFEEVLRWEWEVAKILGIDYVPESGDCDDFAVGFAWAVSRAAAKAGTRAAPLIARIVIAQPPAARHALNGVATDRGLFLVEPQPHAGGFRITPLTAFPRDRILSVVLGDYQPN